MLEADLQHQSLDDTRNPTPNFTRKASAAIAPREESMEEKGGDLGVL